jgi:hypothetical protein
MASHLTAKRAMALAILLIGLRPVTAGAPPAPGGPQRKVAGHAITSERDPKVRIEVPAAARYVGADRWVLYDVADCELHAFVETDAEGKVERRYWVQFEAYLPEKPDQKYEYGSPRRTTLGGKEFYVDTWVRPSDVRGRPGSDGEHVRALIEARGYRLPAALMSVRLVHLLDGEKRKELMIIYSEDAAATGVAVADLLPGGGEHDRWPVIADGLIDRARARIALQFGSEAATD